jgi:hypothetical protein
MSQNQDPQGNDQVARPESCEWIIEREFGPQGEWREVARIPGQLEEDFSVAEETP